MRDFAHRKFGKVGIRKLENSCGPECQKLVERAVKVSSCVLTFCTK